MARRVDLARLQAKSLGQLASIENRFKHAEATLPKSEYYLRRWIAAMTAVETHGVWERYAERRLVTALAHHPEHLIAENAIRGLTEMPVGLAELLVRGTGRYFDYRSFEDLSGKASRLVGKAWNPFLPVPPRVRGYLDALAAIRNFVVHRSDVASLAYRRALRTTYSVAAVPEPDEFLNAVDLRRTNSMGRRKRILGLIDQVRLAIRVS